jgi:DNA-binding response OmpR family regulator
LSILFISAREEKMDQVMALDNGADNYITKLFNYEIMIANQLCLAKVCEVDEK